MERGNFEAGQPINTDDAMNDMPKDTTDKFVEGIQKKIEDGVYTQEEGDALIAKAEARRAEKNEAEVAAAQAAEDDAAYNAWANMTPEEADAHHDAIVNNFEGETVREGDFAMYPRMAGESNEEYGARLREMHEATKQFQEENSVAEEPAEKNALDAYKDMVEKRVESGDLKREDADAMIAKRAEDYGNMQEQKAEESRNEEAIKNFNEAQEQYKMEMAEKIRKEVPEALEMLEKHPELKAEMVAAVKRLEELDEIAKIEKDADKAISDELIERNKTFMTAVEAFNAAARANEAARARMAEFEKKGNGSDDEYNEILGEIHKTEDDMKTAEADKNTADNVYNTVESAIREDAEKRTGEIKERMEAREAEIAENREKYNEEFIKAQEEYQSAEEANNAARAKMAELEQSGKATDEELQAAEDEIHATEKAMADARAKMDSLKQDQTEADEADGAGEDAGAKEAGEDADAGAEDEKMPGGGFEAGETEDKEFQKFFDNYFNDEDFRAVFTHGGVFDEEACRGAITNMYNAKKIQDEEEAKRAADVKQMKGEEGGEADDDAGAEDGEKDSDDGFENDEQRGLFAKIKGFFNRSKRAKAGGEKAAEKAGLRGWKKAVFATMLGLLIGTQAANFINSAGLTGDRVANSTGSEIEAETAYAAEVEDTEGDKVDLKDVSENLSLEVDLNAEKGEELSDLVDTTSYGEDIEVNVSYGDYSGETEFLDYENKHGRHNLTRELYDMDNESLTDVQKAEQIAEGLANVLDDSIEQGQFASMGGADVQINGKADGIMNLNDMNEVLDLSRQDDEFRIALADYSKEMLRDLVENHDLQVEHRAKGSLHQSLYAYELQLEDGTSDINYAVDKDGVRAQEDFDVLQFMDENGQNVLDNNDIGGYKYNFLKAVGIIPENASDEDAHDIMSKIRIIGFSGKCGQLIWENITPDTGSEGTGNEGTGNEGTGEEGTGTEDTGEEGTGTENENTGDEGTGTENEGTGDEGTGTENEGTGTEGTGTENETGTEDEGTGTENETGTEDEGTGTENETGTEDEGTGTENETGVETGVETGIETGVETGVETGEETGDEYDGKTDVLPGDQDDNWDQNNQPTQGETGSTSEADNAPVDEGGNGYANDETPGSSSNLAEDDFLNGGDTGGGNTDADGGGSTNPETEASYDGGDTSGWQGETPSEESGTQTVEEPSTQEEANQVNDSESNQESAGESQDPGEGAAEAMDRLG